MSPTRSRITGVAVSAALLLSSLGSAAPVAATDSPEHAVDELLEPVPGFEPSVSTEGLCELVSPAELSAVSALEFDTSSGFETFCTYFTADLDTFYSILVTLWLNGDAESVAAFYEADQPLEVAAATAFASGAEGFTQQLFTQAGEDVLQVTLALDDDASESVDSLTQAIVVTELFLPLLASFRLELVGPTPAPTPEPTPEISLCESLTLADINSATGLGFDDASGNSDYCSYSSIDGDPGYTSVTVSLTSLSLDEYRAFVTDVKDTTVAGLPAITGISQLIVELPDGARTLSVFAILDPSDEAATLTDDEVAIMVAELVAPNVPVPDTDPLEVPPEDPAAVTGGQPTLLRPLCEYIDLDAVNAIGVASYDTVADIGPDFCSLSQTDLGIGISQLMVYVEPLAIDELRSFYPDGTDVTIAGRPGYESDAAVWVQTDAGLISIQAFLPDDASGEGIDPGQITIPVAEMVAAGIEADAQ